MVVRVCGFPGHLLAWLPSRERASTMVLIVLYCQYRWQHVRYWFNSTTRIPIVPFWYVPVVCKTCVHSVRTLCIMVQVSNKHSNTWILDVGVVCPGTQRYVDHGSGTTPGLAAEAYAAVKVAKYADQDNFIPFILETGGRVNKAARDWLDSLTAPDPGEHLRGTRRRGLPLRPSHMLASTTEAMQALVRVQAHMLARIVVEIRAADIAVELEPQLYRDVFYADNAHWLAS